MTKQQSARTRSRAVVVLPLIVSLTVVDAYPNRVLGQLPSNWHLTAHEPFKTCARNVPARTTLSLATVTGDRVRARTEAAFFQWPADSGQWIGLTQSGKNGWAQVTGFTDSRHVTVRITTAFEGSGLYGPGTWARWPFCYMSITAGKYGFNAGLGHQKDNTRLTLDFSLQQYSVDRCSLAHDSYYWGPETGDAGAGDANACNNNYWVGFCFGKIERQTKEEDEAYEWLDNFWQTSRSQPARALRPPVLVGWRVANPCNAKRDWIELPKNARDIPDASCYKGKGQPLVGLNGKALDVFRENQSEGAKVVLWDTTGGCNQKWRMVPGPQSPAKWGYEIRGFAGMCLGTPPGTRPRPGHEVKMYHCNTRYTYTQRWHHEHGQLRVRDPRTPRLCLAVNERASPMIAIVAKCASINPQVNPSQQWRFLSQ
jgi:hypothetical protein